VRTSENAAKGKFREFVKGELPRTPFLSTSANIVG
jgi:hypothetical protein